MNALKALLSAHLHGWLIFKWSDDFTNFVNSIYVASCCIEGLCK